MFLPSAIAALRRVPARAWALAAALAAAFLCFQSVYGLRLLNASDAYWSNPHGDMGQMLAGELAGLRAPWTLPILTTDALLAPERVSLVFTDSIPWLTALLKLTHLGRTFSLMGTFLLLAWLAQPVAMYALLRACGVRRASTVLAGCLLSLMVPAWLIRQMGHIALSGHAIQIAALALAVHAIRKGISARTASSFVALGVFAIGVHAYHVPPVTLMLAAAVGGDILQRREGAARRGVRAILSYFGALAVAGWFLGYAVGRGPSGGVDALGLYEMNLLSPVFPNHSVLIAPAWINGWFTHAFGPGTLEQDFEGYNFVGVGGLVLLVTAGLLLRRERHGVAGVSWNDETRLAGSPAAEDLDRPLMRRWGPLAAALVVLTLYALGTKPYVGAIHIFTVPLPHRSWMEPLALFRGHGRFFWTVGYALLAGGLTVVDRLASPRLRLGVMLAAVLLQAVDTGRLRADLRTQFSRPEPLKVPAALREPAFRGRDLLISPGFFCTTSQENMDRARQLSVIAQRNDASTNAAETVRAPRVICPEPAPDLLVDAAPGDRRITVVQRGDLMPVPVTNAFTHRHDCFAAGEGLWLCGRDLAGTPGLRAVDGHDLATPVHDAALDIGSLAFRAALASGWSTPEADHVWSDGHRAVLWLPHPALPEDGILIVDLEAMSYQPAGHSPQRVRVSLPDGSVRDLRVPGNAYDPVELHLPAHSLPPGPVNLTFDLPDALSPKSVQLGSSDTRELGISLRRITLAH